MPDQYPNLYDVYSRLGNIEGKVDSILGITKHHEDRINIIEKIQDQMVGKVSIISAIFGFVGAGIITAIGWFLKK